MSDSDFQEIQPVGLPRKRYPSRKPCATMGDKANQDSVVASQDCVVAQEVEDVALEVIQLERDKLDKLLKLCQYKDNYPCSIM